MFSDSWMHTSFSYITLLFIGVLFIDVSNAQTLSTSSFVTQCSSIIFTVRASGSPRFWSYDFLINDGSSDLAIVNIGINSTYFVVDTDAGNGFLGQYSVNTSTTTVATTGADPFNATLEFFNLSMRNNGNTFFAARGAVSTNGGTYNKIVCPQNPNITCSDASCSCNTNVTLVCDSVNQTTGLCQEDGTYSINTSCPEVATPGTVTSTTSTEKCQGWAIGLDVVCMLANAAMGVLSVLILKGFISLCKENMSQGVFGLIFLVSSWLFTVASVLMTRFGCEPGSFPQWAIVLIVALCIIDLPCGIVFAYFWFKPPILPKCCRPHSAD